MAVSVFRVSNFLEPCWTWTFCLIKLPSTFITLCLSFSLSPLHHLIQRDWRITPLPSALIGLSRNSRGSWSPASYLSLTVLLIYCLTAGWHWVSWWIRILILSHRATLWSVLLGFIVWIPKIRDVFWEDRRTLIYKQVPGNWPLRRDKQDIISFQVSRNRHKGLNMYSASGLARCKWICFFIKTYLEKCNIIWIARQETPNSW